MKIVDLYYNEILVEKDIDECDIGRVMINYLTFYTDTTDFYYSRHVQLKDEEEKIDFGDHLNFFYTKNVREK